jgi:hypothetical protein
MTTLRAIGRLPRDRTDAILNAARADTEGGGRTSRSIVEETTQDVRDWLADHFRMDPTPISHRDALSLYDALMSTTNTPTASAGWATEYTFTQRIYKRSDGKWILDRADRNKETP